ncbi:hypothetical protein EDM54_01660 [Brevibacillus borstelensis]|uniref:hypothetical protein n=1 Tax=Brevibacillus borstelensis TaxID=45462 RepID=UPI0004F37E12|nr:hypothetical protein [Brevibacillus borstelensis]KKX56344.1 hypothetical protein X546_04450 [Brevibacillus borstelensis cifa_chp40]MED1881066.1 hypothetical protein [Brevibacillus borstelensis]MED2006698.1 hypothetical protein [Brevibacillus borstelensis]RNB66404.1 hypothetical protein EDM54_01660 [Brevibacillus borstelensis]GED53540.1 hypothetical protein BBO01nite_27810 [Brevibacillus borstelensis]
MARARDIKLKNNQLYDENGDVFLAVQEASFVSKFSYVDVNRLQKGKTQSIDEAHVEVTIRVSSVNADLKYYVVSQLHKGKTPVIPMMIGEQWDKEAGNIERVKLTNIVLNPEEIILWAAKAEGNDIATFELKGMSSDEPVFINKLPEYEED